MRRLATGISLILFTFFYQVKAQTVNFYDCWKLVKIVENEIDQPLPEGKILLIDPNGIMAYYDLDLDSIVVNGTWKKYGLHKVNITRGRKTQYQIQSWTKTDVIISPMNNLNRCYHYSRLEILRAIVSLPKW